MTMFDGHLPHMDTEDGAGVRLTRILGTAKCDHLDPFLLFDQFRSDDPDQYIRGFPPHPHRGFETVTYMLEGHMRHRDSVGNEGHLGPGDVQWMTAGKGIVHSEMPEMENGLMWGYQLWVNLPAAQKMVEPRYQDIPAAQIPELAQSGRRVRVIAGHYKDIEGAGQTRTPVLYLDVILASGVGFDHSLPATHQGFLHMVQGQVFSGDAMVAAAGTGSTPVLESGATLGLRAGEAGARFLLIAGEPIGEPIARHGPFVMNTRAELVQAFDDYQSGLF